MNITLSHLPPPTIFEHLETLRAIELPPLATFLGGLTSPKHLKTLHEILERYRTPESYHRIDVRELNSSEIPFEVDSSNQQQGEAKGEEGKIKPEDRAKYRGEPIILPEGMSKVVYKEEQAAIEMAERYMMEAGDIDESGLAVEKAEEKPGMLEYDPSTAYSAYGPRVFAPDPHASTMTVRPEPEWSIPVPNQENQHIHQNGTISTSLDFYEPIQDLQPLSSSSAYDPHQPPTLNNLPLPLPQVQHQEPEMTPLPPQPPKRRIRELRLDLRTLDAAALFALETWRRKILDLPKMNRDVPDSIWYQANETPSPSPPPQSPAMGKKLKEKEKEKEKDKSGTPAGTNGKKRGRPRRSQPVGQSTLDGFFGISGEGGNGNDKDKQDEKEQKLENEVEVIESGKEVQDGAAQGSTAAAAGLAGTHDSLAAAMNAAADLNDTIIPKQITSKPSSKPSSKQANPKPKTAQEADDLESLFSEHEQIDGIGIDSNAEAGPEPSTTSNRRSSKSRSESKSVSPDVILLDNYNAQEDDDPEFIPPPSPPERRIRRTRTSITQSSTKMSVGVTLPSRKIKTPTPIVIDDDDTPSPGRITRSSPRITRDISAVRSVTTTKVQVERRVSKTKIQPMVYETLEQATTDRLAKYAPEVLKRMNSNDNSTSNSNSKGDTSKSRSRIGSSSSGGNYTPRLATTIGMPAGSSIPRIPAKSSLIAKSTGGARSNIGSGPSKVGKTNRGWRTTSKSKSKSASPLKRAREIEDEDEENAEEGESEMEDEIEIEDEDEIMDGSTDECEMSDSKGGGGGKKRKLEVVLPSLNRRPSKSKKRKEEMSGAVGGDGVVVVEDEEWGFLMDF